MAITLEAGTSVSHYRIVAPIGAGGMGEVYKAHDSTLERTVALKILPPEVVRSEERVRRFIQEAKSASSLNHPNIVTIHEIGQADVPSREGGESGAALPIHYIAMELIDGATLKRAIHQDNVDLRSLLVYLSQAAEGLAKAHAAGLVHRDLKPENIMVTRDGFAKVLDFGLAKLSATRSASESNIDGATAVRNATREGALLGTVGYMSPEQVQGKVVDYRSDIFSFGCILYEAATRRRPFEADSDVDVMHKILHDKPVPIDEIAPEVPAELRRLIRRCLAKDADKRFQSMKDLALELSEIVEEYETLSASASSGSSGSLSRPVEPLTAPRRRMLWLAAAVVTLVTAAALSFAVYEWRRARANRNSAVSFESMKVERLTSSGNITQAAISSDGKYVAHVIRDAATGRFSLWVRQVATGSDVQVVAPVPTPLSGVAFSPDGNYLFYEKREQVAGAGYGSLYQVPTLGGTPRKLIFDVDTRVTFSPDGRQLAFGRGDLIKTENNLMVANADGTAERALLVEKRTNSSIGPAWSPDGKKILISRYDTSANQTRILEVEVATGKSHPVGEPWDFIIDLAWLPDGSGIVLTGGRDQGRPQVWLEPYPEGKPARITNDLNAYAGVTLTSDGKTLATVQRDRKFDLAIADPSDESGGKPFASLTEQVGNFSLSAAGPLVYDFGRGSRTDIAIIDAPGSGPRILTSGGNNFLPAISGDGKTIVFTSQREGGVPHLFAMTSEGSDLRQLTHGPGEFGSQIAMDGQFVLYGLQNLEVWKVPLRGGTPVKVLDNASTVALAPDSKRIAYVHYQAGVDRTRIMLAVAPVDGGPPLVDVPAPQAFGLRWTPKGDALTGLRPVNGATNVFRWDLPSGAETQLTHFKKGLIGSYAWTPEGKLVMTRGEVQSDVVLIHDFR